MVKFDFNMNELSLIELAGKVVQETGVFRGNVGYTALRSIFQHFFLFHNFPLYFILLFKKLLKSFKSSNVSILYDLSKGIL
jgi:hypothetical protein